MSGFRGGALLALAFVGCGGPSPGDSDDTVPGDTDTSGPFCDDNGDCDVGSVCEEGACRAVCEEQGLVCGEYEGIECGACPEGPCIADQTACAIELPALDVDATFAHLGAEDVFVWGPIEAGGDIWRVPLDGSNAGRFAGASGYLLGDAVNSDSVFYTDNGQSVYAAPQSGGSPKRIASLSPSTCASLAADEDYLYCGRNDASGEPASNGIARIGVGGSALTMLTTAESNMSNLAVGNGRVYYASTATGSVYYVDTDGGASKRIRSGSGAGTVRHVFVGSDAVYVTLSSGLYAMSFEGSGSTEIRSGGNVFAQRGSDLFVTGGSGLVRLDESTGDEHPILDESYGSFISAGFDAEGYLVTTAVGDDEQTRVYRIPLD
jgi:hypothetical protein